MNLANDIGDGYVNSLDACSLRMRMPKRDRCTGATSLYERLRVIISLRGS